MLDVPYKEEGGGGLGDDGRGIRVDCADNGDVGVAREGGAGGLEAGEVSECDAL